MGSASRVTEIFREDWRDPMPLAWRVGDTILAQGITGVDPATGALAESLAGQTEQALATMREMLERAGASVDNVARVTAFVSSVEDRVAFYGPWEAFYAEPRPACKVLPTALPPGHRVRLDVLALAGATRERVDVPGVPAHDPTVKVGNLLLSSRVHGTDPTTGEMPDGFQAQAPLAFQNIAALLAVAGGSPASLTQVTVFLRDNPAHRAAAQQAFDALVGSATPRAELRLQEAFMRPPVHIMIEFMATL